MDTTIAPPFSETIVASLATSITSTTTTMTDLVSTNGAQGGTLVVNPSTATLQITCTLGYAATFSESDSPAISIVFTPSAPLTATSHTSLETFTPAQTIQPTYTDILTQIDATYFFADSTGSITSTSTTAYLYGPTSYATAPLNDNDSGFDSWSPGAKAGLIVGVVFAALILLWLCICCCKRNAAWVAHDWRWAGAVEGSTPGMANANLAYPGTVMSPAAYMSTPSYGYTTPSPMYLRGGAENKGGVLPWLQDKLRWKR